MERIYLDSLFILELAADYLLCLCTGRLLGLTLRRRRYLAAALFGAGYSLLSLLPRLGFLALPVMKLCSGLALSLIAFGAEESYFRCAGVFFALSALFGGLLWAISLAGGRPAFDMRTLFLAFALIYGALRLLFGRRLALAERDYAEARIELGGRVCRFRVLIDSGNCLAEPVSGRSVLVASPGALSPLFPGQEALLELPAAEFALAAAELPRLRGRLRLVPFSALSGGGLMAAFVPEAVYIDGEERSLAVAVSPEARGEGFEGIL